MDDPRKKFWEDLIEQLRDLRPNAVSIIDPDVLTGARQEYDQMRAAARAAHISDFLVGATFFNGLQLTGSSSREALGIVLALEPEP